EFLCGGTPGAGHQFAHLVEARVQHLLGTRDAAATRDSPSRRKRGTAHDAGGPDVAVDTTFVAQAVGEPGLAQQFVKLSLVSSRDPGADFSNASIVRSGLGFAGNRGADGSEQCVGQFERCWLGNVEAVDEAVANQVKVARERRAGFPSEGTQA